MVRLAFLVPNSLLEIGSMMMDPEIVGRVLRQRCILFKIYIYIYAHTLE